MGDIFQSASSVAGILLVFAGVVLWLVEAGRVADDNWLARSLDGWWRALVASPGWDVPWLATRRLSERLGKVIRVDFEQADRGPAFGIVFLAMMFVLIPAAAVANLLTGGSPFLALYYLSNLAALAMLNFTGESRRLAPVNRTAAFYLGLSVFLIIPAYVFHSFTDRMLHSPISHAVLESLLVAPLLFIVAQSLMLGWDSYLRAASRGVTRFVKVFLAGLPAAYVLTFVAWQAGAFVAEPEGHVGTWPLLISSVLFSALALSVTAAILDWISLRPGQGRLALGLVAAALAGIGSAVCELSTLPTALSQLHPTYRPMLALPLLPFLYVAGGVLVNLIGKLLAAPLVRVLGDGTIVTKPILALGVLCVTMGIAVWAVGLLS